MTKGEIMKRILQLAVLFAGLTLQNSMAWAQCATGVDTGGGNCVPPESLGVNGNTAEGPAAPGPLWEDRWGAVVHDTSGRTGVANDERSKSDAIAKATNTCTADGSSHCKVMISFRNTCVAYATGDSGYNTAFTNPSEDTAKRDALSDCKGRDTRCEVIYSACSVPVRVR